MKYHPQLMNLEDRALFYHMKDLESLLPNLTPEQENMLFALYKKFNCLSFLTPEQEAYKNKLEKEIEDGHQLSPEKQKNLSRLKQLPKPEPEVSDILGLTAPESRQFKRLQAKRKND